VLDNGDGGLNNTFRSNCVFHATVTTVGDSTNAGCSRSVAHSAFLTGRMTDNNPNTVPGPANITRYMMVGGVGLTPQNPLMYKNGW